MPFRKSYGLVLVGFGRFCILALSLVLVGFGRFWLVLVGFGRFCGFAWFCLVLFGFAF